MPRRPAVIAESHAGSYGSRKWNAKGPGGSGLSRKAILEQLDGSSKTRVRARELTADLVVEVP